MLRSLVAFGLALGMTSSAFAMDKAYFQIDKVLVNEVTDDASLQALNQNLSLRDVGADACTGSVTPTPTPPARISVNPIDGIAVVVDQIINIGKAIFKVIDAGKSVVNIKMDTASALPKGIQCWTDLAGWNAPQSKVYRVRYLNGMKMTVIDFSYRVVFTSGGNVNGIGKYITNATIQPANLAVAWGFNFDATAQVPSVFNQGTKEQPVAGMQLNLAWKVTSVLGHQESTEIFYVTGENKLTHLE